MDPFTALHLVTAVASGAYSFISNAYIIFQKLKAIKDAPDRAQKLSKEIASVLELLESLKRVVTQPRFTTSASLTDDLNKSLLDQMNARIAIMKPGTVEQMKVTTSSPRSLSQFKLHILNRLIILF